MIMLTLVTLAKVFSKGPVTAHRVKGAIAVYLLFGMTWSLLYGLLDQSLPNAFNLPAGQVNRFYSRPAGNVDVFQLHHPDNPRLRRHHPGP